MALRLNTSGYEHAEQLIKAGKRVVDGRGDWSEDQPSAADENDYISEHGFDDYARWHLGINDEHRDGTKGRYEFPYGDLKDVHRSALLAAESRAGQYGHRDIELAAARLLGMLELDKSS